MGLHSMFRRRNETDGSDAIGLGSEEGDLEVGAGGPSFFRQELAELRWAAQSEALNVARSGIDPTRWDDGRLAFDFERGLAHGYSGLRDRLANVVGDRIREQCRELYDLAADVGNERANLARIDHTMEHTMREWKQNHEEVIDNQLDLNRYLRLKFVNSNVIKVLVAGVFVLSEFIISGRVFEQLLSDLPPGLGYVLAFGVTLALIVIPHFAALGLKDGLTQHHRFDKEAIEAAGQAVPPEKERAVHVEEKDDKGFRWAASLVGIGLLIMIIPLTVIRVKGEGDGFDWWSFFFLILLQYSLSGYFFLREWLDHGQPSHRMHMSDKSKEHVERLRAKAISDLGSAAAAFHNEAEDLIFTITQAPRWDSYIVSSYYETIRYCRHLIRLANPEYEQFITWARVPYLGSQSSAMQSPFPVDPLSNEHMLLEEDSLLGREWLLRTTTGALSSAAMGAEATASAPEVRTPDVSWLMTKSPDQLLETFLMRYYGLPLSYSRSITGIFAEDHEAQSEKAVSTAPASPIDFDTHFRTVFGNGTSDGDQSLASPPSAPEQTSGQ
jgi:hypothetical protein